jgi:hypothetical protein
VLVIASLASGSLDAYPHLMTQISKVSRFWFLLVPILLSSSVGAATKLHVISFGRWTLVQAFAAPDSAPLAMKVRSLMVDGRTKEYVIGLPHEITDRLFVVRRAFRVNDSLPVDSAPRWQWQLGGWLIVDRVTGRVSSANLPAFDPYLSSASWYRDYIAYCGVDDAKQTYAIIAQLNRRKPVLKKALTAALKDNAEADSICPAPVWMRNPIRVSFSPDGIEKQTFAIRGTLVDLVEDEADEE